MKVSEAITRFRRIVDDISDEYSDEHIMMLLNEAAQLTAGLLADMASSIVLHRQLFENGDTLPHNFLRTAGRYPVSIVGNKVNFLIDEEVLMINYFATVDRVTATTDDMPFEHDGLNDYVVRMMVILARNDNEFDVTQDRSLLDELKNAIGQAI